MCTKLVIIKFCIRYIVDRSWLEAWKEYVGYNYQSKAGRDYAHPGPVETSTLLKGAVN